ncbi:type IV pilus assembly protein PilM [Vibrio kasasachensis]|uniref:type IV pilus assembly protein PilM n=1 Tax=Vibrio kasasachensis TaxID=2910248 RepID=UPI003D124B83
MSLSFITGVDIGHYSIKAVVIKPVKGTLVLTDFRELVIEESIFSDNHLLNYQQIVNKLKELRKALPLFSRKVALSVPDNSVISKVLQIDKHLSVQEKEYAIIELFSHQTPFELEELCLDYCAIPINNPSELTEPIQIYATKKEVVDNRVDAFRKAGFTPLLLDVHAHGLVRLWQAVASIQNRSNWLLLEVGYTRSSLVIDFVGQAPWCKELPIGVEIINHPIEDDASTHHCSTMHFINSLVERIQRQLQLIGTMDKKQLQGIWLTGGGANTPMLAEELASRLDVECELFDPLSLLISSPRYKNQRLPCGYSYASAMGLALQGIDWMEQGHASSN